MYAPSARMLVPQQRDQLRSLRNERVVEVGPFGHATFQRRPAVPQRRQGRHGGKRMAKGELRGVLENSIGEGQRAIEINNQRNVDVSVERARLLHGPRRLVECFGSIAYSRINRDGWTGSASIRPVDRSVLSAVAQVPHRGPVRATCRYSEAQPHGVREAEPERRPKINCECVLSLGNDGSMLQSGGARARNRVYLEPLAAGI